MEVKFVERRREEPLTEAQIQAKIRQYERMTDEELLDIIRQRTEQLGHPPRKEDIPGAPYFKHRLGPWPRILEQAGVKVKPKKILLREEKAAAKVRNQNRDENK